MTTKKRAQILLSGITILITLFVAVIFGLAFSFTNNFLFLIIALALGFFLFLRY